MTHTLALPSGRKIRSSSQRRFILVMDSMQTNPAILKRSDSLPTLRKHRFDKNLFAAVIVDQVSGRVVV